MSTDKPPNAPDEPVISYQSPPLDHPNSSRKFFLRMLSGIGIGIAMLILGFLLTSISRASGGTSIFLFFLPLIGAVIVSTVILLRTRRYGYVTGLLLAPLALVGLVAMLLLMICGVGALSH